MSKAKPLPPLERLDHLFEVRNGSLFNRVGRQKAAAGAEAGVLNHSTGYRDVCVDYLKYKVHRLIWAMVHRQDPGVLVVDHIDRNKLNNHPSNLRAIPKRLNALNTDGHKHNTSGVTGVVWASRERSWAAQAKFHGKHIWLGYYKNKEDAINARKAWEQEQWAA